MRGTELLLKCHRFHQRVKCPCRSASSRGHEIRRLISQLCCRRDKPSFGILSNLETRSEKMAKALIQILCTYSISFTGNACSWYKMESTSGVCSLLQQEQLLNAEFWRRCRRESCGQPLAAAIFGQSAQSGTSRRRHHRARNIKYDLGSSDETLSEEGATGVKSEVNESTARLERGISSA